MGKIIIITAGGTTEPIDGVRSIKNSSTGKLGYTICMELINLKAKEIDKIYYICPKEAIIPDKNEKIEIVTITDTNSVKEKVEKLLTNNRIDYFIHSMAISDYKVKNVTNAKMLATYVSENLDKTLDGEELTRHIEHLIRDNKQIIDKSKKVSSYEDNIIINLEQTPKIISLIKDLSKDTYLVGFKLLNNVTEKELCDVAYNLLQKNNCDLVVANDMKTISNEEHKAIIIDKQGNKLYANTKQDIAKKIINIIM